MRRFSKFFSVMLLVMLSVCALHADSREDSYVVIRRGRGTKKIEGRDLRATPNGQVSIMTNRGRMAFGRGQYVYAMVPRPEEVEKLEELLDNERYNDLTTQAPKAFEAYKYLGWGDVIAKMHCEGLIALKRTDEAEKFLQMAFRFPRKDEYNLQSVRLQLMVHDKKVDEVEQQLAKLMSLDDDVLHAFVFNMRGNMAEIAGDKKGAVLQYLKTFMLFEDKRKFRRFRKEAKENAMRLMKEIKDPTVARLAEMK